MRCSKACGRWPAASACSRRSRSFWTRSARMSPPWARRLATLARLARIALWLLAGVLGAALIAVTFNTIRLQILTQREEIEVSKLIGATDAFIRRPFYYAGLLQGPAGDALAFLVFAALLGWLGAHLSASRHLRAIEPR